MIVSLAQQFSRTGSRHRQNQQASKIPVRRRVLHDLLQLGLAANEFFATDS
jgi:hypothetical protein